MREPVTWIFSTVSASASSERLLLLLQ